MKHFCKTLIFCMLILGGWPVATQAQEVPNSDSQVTRTFTFEAMGFMQDQKATGVIADIVYSFDIPRTWEPAIPEIKLHFSHSPLLLPDLSQMTILYNDIPVKDVYLTRENATESWLEITVPQTALRPGQHRLKIQVYQRLTDDHCGDDQAPPALWTVIHKDSTISFTGKRPNDQPDLSLFPEPFSTFGRPISDPLPLTIVLPKQPTHAEYKAAGLAAAKMGQMAGVRKLDLAVSLGKLPIRGDVFVIAQSENIVELLGNTDNLPLALENGTFDKTAEDDGVIQLIKRLNGEGMLVLSGQSELGLTRSGLAISDDYSLSLMSGPFALIKETPQQPSNPRHDISWTGEGNQLVTNLETLTGSQDQRLTGITIDQLQTCFRLPPNWEVGPTIPLDLNYTHSASLWADRSSMTVKLNNATVISTPLDPQLGTDQSLKVELPAHELIDGFNCLRFEFALRLNKNACSVEHGGEAWVEISSASAITIPYDVIDSYPFTSQELSWVPDFAQHPYPFNLDAHLAHTTIVLPDQPTTAEIEGALRLAAKLGNDVSNQPIFQNIPESAFRLELISAADWDPQLYSDGNLFVIGDAKRNRALSDIETGVATSVPLNETTLTTRDQLLVRQESGVAIAVAELMPSPWRTDRAILHVTGQSQTALTHLFELLTVNQAEHPLNGNMITVSESGIVHSVDTLGRPDRPSEIVISESGGVEQQELQNLATIRWFLIGGGILLAQIALTAIGLTLRDVWKRRRQEDAIS